MEVENALEARRQLGASLVANLGNILMQRRRNPIQTEVEVSGAKFNCVAVVNGFWRAEYTRGCHVLARQRVN